MDINTLKSWFQKGFKPTQEQFWSLIDSFRQKDEPVPVSEVAGLPSMLAGKADQGHKHTLADITDYNEEKEVLNGLLAMEASELEALPRTDGMYYIVLADDTLYRCAYNEETEEYNLEQVSPSSRVIYSVKDSEGSMRIYLFSDNQGVFQDVTGEVVDKTIYVQSLDELLTRELTNGVYTIVHVSTGKDDNMYGDVYMLTVGDGGSLSSRVLECKSGWAQSVVIDDDWNYSWQWHKYSYEGHQHTTDEVSGLNDELAKKSNTDHGHKMGAIEGLSDALAGKADSVHTHTMGDVTGLVGALKEKAAAIHSHAIESITGLADALAGKAAASHSHTTAEVSGLNDELAKKSNTDHGHKMGAIEGLSDALAGKADSVHTHTMGDVTGLVGALKEKAAAIHSHAIESITGLADALAGKAAASHSHTTAEVSGLNDELAKKSNTGHGHKMGAIEGLSDALAGKADTVHTHTMGEVTGLVGALKEKAAAIHSHAIESITGLAAALAGKQATISDLDSIRSGAAAGATALQTHQDISGKQDKTDSSLPTVAKTIVGAIKELWEKLKDFLHGIQHVTWEELKEMRDSGELVAGQWYRITDYVTTVANDPEARSAGHPFDLLVMATSNDTLSEEARAVRSSRSELVPAKFYSGSWGTWFVRDSSSDGSFDGDDYYAWRNENDELAYTLTLHPEDSADVYVVYDEDGNNFCHIEQADYMESFDEYGESVDEFQAEHEYFAHSNLNAWKVWYCIDNDTTRFAWADPDDGTGVIYRMIDEWQNDCPYDFKNVQFKRYRVVDDSPNGELAELDGQYYGFLGDLHHLYVEDEDDFKWMYTFSLSDDNGNIEDYSLREDISYDSDMGFDYWSQFRKGRCEYNEIRCTYSLLTIDDNSYRVRTLNNIVLISHYTDGVSGEMLSNRIDAGCYNMTLKDNPERNVLGNSSHDNVIGSYANVTGIKFCYNTFGNGFQYNTFGNSCGSNTFGNDCYENTFGNYCDWNTFGNYFQVNTFGNYCYRNTFGNSCGSNTFGNDCGGNTFGNDCYWNTFGNYCYRNTFGNYLRYITVFEGVQYVYVPGGSNDNNCVKNLQILNGTHGSNESNRLAIAIDPEQDYCQIAGLNSDGELRIWAPADLV